MKVFEFTTPSRIVFGEGSSQTLADEAAHLGQCALLVTGRSADRSTAALKALQKAGIATQRFSVSGEPDLLSIRGGLAIARNHGADLIIGFGGGSVIDTAKAIAVLATNSGDVLEYLEIGGNSRKIENNGLPCIAIPTTAGTGAEATRNAVIADRKNGAKVSLRHQSMLPNLALVDPMLSWFLPPEQTAWGGMDALTQLIEAFLGNAANPLTDGLCRDGIKRCARSLRAAWLSANARLHQEEPKTLTKAEQDARCDLSLAALQSGLSLANSRLGAVHGLASPLGGRLEAPHGALCAALLPATLALNLSKARESGGSEDLLERYKELGTLLTGSPQTGADEAINWLTDLGQSLEIPPLNHWGLKQSMYGEIIAAALKASSMKGNPVSLNESDLQLLLDNCSRKPSEQ